MLRLVLQTKTHYDLVCRLSSKRQRSMSIDRHLSHPHGILVGGSSFPTSYTLTSNTAAHTFIKHCSKKPTKQNSRGFIRHGLFRTPRHSLRRRRRSPHSRHTPPVPPIDTTTTARRRTSQTGQTGQTGSRVKAETRPLAALFNLSRNPPSLSPPFLASASPPQRSPSSIPAPKPARS